MTFGRVVGSALVLSALLPALCRAQDAAPAAAGDVMAGRKVATQICQTCHGMDGLAQMPEIPNLAGMDVTYLQHQLQAFRAGARKNESMSMVIGMIDDKKAADVAAYYNAIKVQVTSVPGKTP